MNTARYYRLAVASSLVSKLGTTILQLLLTPLAAIALGGEGFALYVMLIAASSWLAITSFGLGPILSVQVACNVVEGNVRREQTIISSAFWTSLGFSLFAATMAAVAVIALPTNLIFGSQFELRSHEIVVGFLTLVAIYVLQVNISIFEAVQAGLQRQHTTNFVVAMGALVTLPIVFAVARWAPTPVAMLAAGIFPTILIRLGHALWLVSKRMSMLPRLLFFDTQVVKLLLSSGAVYSLAGSAGNFISHALPTIMIGRVLDIAQTGAFAATLHLITLLSGVTAMLVSPAVPAIASSLAQRNKSWVCGAYIKLLIASLGFAVAAALVLAIAGDQIFVAWLRGSVKPSPGLITISGGYLILLTWEVVHFNLLIAINKIKTASMLVFMRTVVGSVIIYVVLPNGGNEMAFLAMCLAILLVDAVPLFILFRKAIIKI
jgi:O-antigen/teichoic acid export membrane protein